MKEYRQCGREGVHGAESALLAQIFIVWKCMGLYKDSGFLL